MGTTLLYSGTMTGMRKRRKVNSTWLGILLGGAGILILGLVLVQLPPIRSRLAWRVDVAATYLRSLVQPAGKLPTAAAITAQTPFATLTPAPSRTPAASLTPSATPLLSPTPTLTPTPIPAQVVLPAPAWEEQGPNNCGAATLAMYLRFYGWQGDQFTISDELKPITADRNVNVEELVYYTRTRAGWLITEYRVGGNLDTLRRFIAAGVPVVIEESSRVEEKYARYDDDYWDGHYLLVNGYDDSAQQFISQDAFLGANRALSYAELEKNWEPFNHVYILIYRPDQADLVKNMLGSDWDADVNRQNALDQAKAKTQSEPGNAFAWFNLGSNLVYFEQYWDAAQAYDQARAIGLPQRMLRYQFGPFLAYFHAGRTEDLMAIVEYALKITNNSEEAWLWKGWGLFRQGKKVEALEAFQKALEYRPGYLDAEYAIRYMQGN